MMSQGCAPTLRVSCTPEIGRDAGPELCGPFSAGQSQAEARLQAKSGAGDVWDEQHKTISQRFPSLHPTLSTFSLCPCH